MQWSDVSFSQRTLRQFSALWIVFFGGLSAWWGIRLAHPTIGIVLMVLALTVGPLGLAKPEFVKPIYAVWMATVFPIGWLMSNSILAILYFAVVTPTALICKLIGRDVLQRKPCPEKDTYWTEKPTPSNTRSYLRQY